MFQSQTHVNTKYLKMIHKYHWLLQTFVTSIKSLQVAYANTRVYMIHQSVLPEHIRTVTYSLMYEAMYTCLIRSASFASILEFLK